MKLSNIQKEHIFSLIEENFYWCTKDNKQIISSFKDNLLDKKGFHIESGAVKYCIFHPFFDNYVVKFCIDSFNYCEREYNNYCAAIARNLDEFFPYTDFLGELNGVAFYIQEKADVDETYVSDIWYHYLNDTYEPWGDDETEDEKYENIWCMIEDLDDDYKVQMIYNNDKLVDFLEEYCINDLHAGNYGMIDNRLVIIDFSGYGQRVKERGF